MLIQQKTPEGGLLFSVALNLIAALHQVPAPASIENEHQRIWLCQEMVDRSHQLSSYFSVVLISVSCQKQLASFQILPFLSSRRTKSMERRELPRAILTKLILFARDCWWQNNVIHFPRVLENHPKHWYKRRPSMDNFSHTLAVRELHSSNIARTLSFSCTYCTEHDEGISLAPTFHRPQLPDALGTGSGTVLLTWSLMERTCKMSASRSPMRLRASRTSACSWSLCKHGDKVAPQT